MKLWLKRTIFWVPNEYQTDIWLLQWIVHGSWQELQAAPLPFNAHTFLTITVKSSFNYWWLQNVQLLMTAKWLTDWLIAAKLLIEDTKSMLRLCWRLLSNLRSMIDDCKSWSQAWLNWTNKVSTFLEKAKPDYFSEKLNWTCRILQAGWRETKRKKLTLTVYLYS